MHVIIHTLFQLYNKYIIWHISLEHHFKSFENQMRKGFTGAIGKADCTDISLLYKPRDDLIDKYYYTRKNQYLIDFHAVCNFSKKSIYAITRYSGVMHNAQVWSLT